VGPVAHAEFDAALRGVDPKTDERLALVGGRGWTHSAGSDMTFSAPKSVSVLWAVSEGYDRAPATAHLERTALETNQATRLPFIRLCRAAF
jgi:hypothetical protein